MPRRAPTSTDVARLCGVSQPTVSYVLNNTPGKRVSDATRERVLQAARDLGYRPSRAAQSLARGRSQIVVLHSPSGPRITVAKEFFTALSARLEAAGWTLLSHFPPAGGEREHLHRLVEATGADAVLDGYGDCVDDEELARLGVAVIPLIAPTAWQLALRIPLRLQLEHLIGRGHRRLALAVPTEAVEHDAVQARIEEAHTWLTSRGFDAPRVLRWTGDLEAFIVTVTDSVREGVTAVAGHNDDTAIPVLAAAAAAGFVVPDDLAVIGIDDTLMARLTVPPLSTVRADLTSSAFTALADRLLAALEHRDVATVASQPAFELVVRSST